LARLLDTASKFALFSVSSLKDKKLIKLHLNFNKLSAITFDKTFRDFFDKKYRTLSVIT